jgi:5-methylcytosine-specific restriction enzyme subunit McrC
MDEERGQIGQGPSLWHLVSQWFVSAAERVLRRDLLRDYREHGDFLRAKRGRIVSLSTARAYYTGRIGLECRYEEFTVDTALNRLLKAAASAVLASPALPPELRRRARAVCARMADVSDAQVADLGVSIERRAAFYTDAVHLARHVLRGVGRVLAAGEHAAWTFLIRTPEAVEEGLRTVLQTRLGEYWAVTKRGIGVGAGLTFTPDLVFADGRAVADVKYKLLQSEWARSDLYQIVAFGTAFRADCAAIICFRTPELSVVPPPLTVGGRPVLCVAWLADPSTSAHEAATQLTDAVRAWLRNCIVEFGAMKVS